VRHWFRTALAAVVVVGAGMAGPAGAADTPYPVSYNFLENTVRIGTAESAPGENDWSCRPTAAHPEPVVLVHGTGGNAATNWATYAALLANNGYCVYALTYGLTPLTAALPVKIGGLGDIRESARQLKDFVARVLASTGADKVDLVGHSQGTLMPDYWVKFLGGAPYVDQYVSLAPLWHGEGFDAAGDLMRMGAAYGFPTSVPLCPACSQMVNGSDLIQQLRSGPDGVAVPGVAYTNIITRLDDVVIPYTSGIETGHPNMRNIILQDVCANDFSDHLEIASSPNAAQLVLNLLDPAHASPLRCRFTLPVNGFVY
jgi:triacylglycerol lipase